MAGDLRQLLGGAGQFEWRRWSSSLVASGQLNWRRWSTKRFFVPNGYLKFLLERAGCPKAAVRDLGSLKLLQALLSIIEGLNAHEEEGSAFASSRESDGWRDDHESMAPLFLNNDLRIADAHETMGGCLVTLQKLGFDTANVNAGYGRALDFVMDGVITSLVVIAAAIESLLGRGCIAASPSGGVL